MLRYFFIDCQYVFTVIRANGGDAFLYALSLMRMFSIVQMA
jgi:hypothetical protein